MNERYIKWYTPWLSCEFEMFVFGDKRGLPLLLFPTSGARYYENKDFGLVGAIASYIDNGKVTVYCPDGIDLLKQALQIDRSACAGRSDHQFHISCVIPSVASILMASQ